MGPLYVLMTLVLVFIDLIHVGRVCSAADVLKLTESQLCRIHWVSLCKRFL